MTDARFSSLQLFLSMFLMFNTSPARHDYRRYVDRRLGLSHPPYRKWPAISGNFDPYVVVMYSINLI